MKPLIEICTQDADFFLTISHIIEVDGFDAVLASSPAETMQLAVDLQPYAVILDCEPETHLAVESCVVLKQNEQTADIVVAALVSPRAENQYIDLLKLGIDEGFHRPMAPKNLLDFLKNMLGDAGAQSARDGFGTAMLVYSDIEMHLASRRVRRDGRELHLGPLEFSILHHFLKHPELVFSREQLIASVWPENIHVEERTVDVHIGTLRKTLKIGSKGDVIRTVRSAGYALDDRSY